MTLKDLVDKIEELQDLRKEKIQMMINKPRQDRYESQERFLERFDSWKKKNLSLNNKIDFLSKLDILK